jgi:predicted peroxiredoxin
MKLIPMLLLFAASYLSALPASSQELPRDGVFIHISHGPTDAHRALMGLTMATRMAADKDVLVYLDIDAVHLVVKDATPVTHGAFKSSDLLIRQLLEAKITVMACPTCLTVAGKTPSDLIEGVQVANKEAFFSFTAGRILTLDY